MQNFGGLYKKLLAVMKECGGIPKNGRNKFHNYDYYLASDVGEAIRKALINNGVLLITSIERVESYQNTSSKGRPVDYVRVTMVFRYVDVDTGEAIEARFEGVGGGVENDDKAIYKAMTGCVKYALMKQFLLGGYDDQEKDDVRESGHDSLSNRLPMVKAMLTKIVKEGGREALDRAWRNLNQDERFALKNNKAFMEDLQRLIAEFEEKIAAAMDTSKDYVDVE